MAATRERSVDPSENQLRILYSLLKPAVRMAARFGIPVRTVADLVKLAYFEHLRRDRDMSHAAIGARMGQTERSMRSLEQKLRSDFFRAESEVGLLRCVEDALAAGPRSEPELRAALEGWEPEALHGAIEQLVREERIGREPGGKLSLGKRYVTLTSRSFQQRIDALNHHLDALHRAIVQRLLSDDRARTMIKTISFDASGEAVEKLARRLEEWLREEVGRAEASSEGDPTARRFMLGVNLARAGGE